MCAQGYAERIKSLRTRLGLTQAQLAERLGVTFATVNRWENNASRPSKLALLRLGELEASVVAAGVASSPVPSSGAGVVEEPLAAYGQPAGTAAQTREEPESAERPVVDFGGNPAVVRLVAEGERLSFGHMFNPSFATETSLIDPLPHQRIAVYDHMVPQPRLRFLLADDAGAGKTIMAGLYIREMLSRRLIRRILIVPPAGLVGNWEREMRTLFNLPFRIVAGVESRTDNPFRGPSTGLLIVSMDTLSGGRTFDRFGESGVEPYDLVVFDEAHKLSADRNPDLTVRKTARYKLAEYVSRRSRHMLLLTATPHMGKDYPYFCLWKLLEPDILSTPEAFHNFPADARAERFIRRVKEEMVYYDGRKIYPDRESQTTSYDLGDEEQRLYDETTAYIRTFYNRARILNRSAVRLAMSIFQRRLASSTYSLLRSFQRRQDKLERLVADVTAGRVSFDDIAAEQQRLEDLPDVMEDMTGDEESSEGELEQNEAVERQAVAGVVAASLEELAAEHEQVRSLAELAKRAYDAGEESKFEKLREVIQDDRFRDEKVLVFTEYRDTLDFLVGRLEGLGFAGQIASIHGGMRYTVREEQVEAFRGPCRIMVATDAAGEGINLQFCWLVINYDIPWNPARLEQRMGRVHRYKQKHDPVVIINILAGKTREGRVLRTVLKKLESIRKELGSDKVFDVIGRQFEGVSIRDLIMRAVVDDEEDAATHEIEGTLTPEQVKARIEANERLLGSGGDVKSRLPEERTKLASDNLRRLLPGYVRRFLEKSAPLVGARIEGPMENSFSIANLPVPLLLTLESYDPRRRGRLTVYRPDEGEQVVFLHPGEPFFDRYREYFCECFGQHALRGGVFVDPYVEKPYLFHLGEVSVLRKVDPQFPEEYGHEEQLEVRLVGLTQDENGVVGECPAQLLMLLSPGRGAPAGASALVASAGDLRELARQHLVERVAEPLAEERRKAIENSLPEREQFVQRGFDYEEGELAGVRSRLTERVRSGDKQAKAKLAKVKEQQQQISARRDRALAVLRREPALVSPGDVRFIAHALVVPSTDPADRKRHDKEIEQIAVRVAWGYEESCGATVEDVSDPKRAMGFDLLSHRPAGEERAIEVKGRRGIGDVELTENEWARAANLRDRYWLYVVYECASANPRLLRVRDPFGTVMAKAKGGVVIGEQAIFEAAEG